MPMKETEEVTTIDFPTVEMSYWRVKSTQWSNEKNANFALCSFNDFFDNQ